jgi:hypothetical protein
MRSYSQTWSPDAETTGTRDSSGPGSSAMGSQVMHVADGDTSPAS